MSLNFRVSCSSSLLHVPQFGFFSFLLLNVPLGAGRLHKAAKPRVREKRAAKRKRREKGDGKTEGERSQMRGENAGRQSFKVKGE